MARYRVGPDDRVSDESIPNIVTRLVAEAKDYGRAEIAYVRAVARDRMSDATRGIALLAGAAVIALAALAALLVGLVLTLMPLVGPGWATLIVVVVALALAGLLAKLGMAKLALATHRDTPEPTG